MDVADFVREHNRMCNEYDLCRGCPMDGICVPCTEAVYKDPQGVVEIVEKWSKAHPVQTNADKFKEVFGMPPAPGYGGWWDRPYKAPKEE